MELLFNRGGGTPPNNRHESGDFAPAELQIHSRGREKTLCKSAKSFFIIRKEKGSIFAKKRKL